MPPTTLQPPLSSTGFAPALTLEARPSRLLRAWWCTLHALLVVATCLVGWPWYAKLLAGVLTLCHAWWRRPRSCAASIAVAADGSCRIHEWGPDVLILTDRTRITPFVLDLCFRKGPRASRLLLLVDQVDRADWARLSAILRRASVK